MTEQAQQPQQQLNGAIQGLGKVLAVTTVLVPTIGVAVRFFQFILSGIDGPIARIALAESVGYLSLLGLFLLLPFFAVLFPIISLRSYAPVIYHLSERNIQNRIRNLRRDADLIASEIRNFERQAYKAETEMGDKDVDDFVGEIKSRQESLLDELRDTNDDVEFVDGLRPDIGSAEAVYHRVFDWMSRWVGRLGTNVFLGLVFLLVLGSSLSWIATLALGMAIGITIWIFMRAARRNHPPQLRDLWPGVVAAAFAATTLGVYGASVGSLYQYEFSDEISLPPGRYAQLGDDGTLLSLTPCDAARSETRPVFQVPKSGVRLVSFPQNGVEGMPSFLESIGSKSFPVRPAFVC